MSGSSRGGPCHLGGALARPPAVPGALGPRDAAYSVGVLSVIEPGQETLADEIAEGALAPFAAAVLGRALSFTYGPLTPDAVRTGFTPEGAERLAALRRTVDPGGMMAPNHEITR